MKNIINGKEYTDRQAHKLLWDWLADNPNKSNEDFFKENKCSSIPINYCYACEDAHRDCKYCLEWVIGTFDDAPCYDNKSILKQYLKSTGVDRQLLAKQIANMEWK